MSSPTSASIPPPTSIYESDTPPQDPEVSVVSVDNDDDDTSNDDEDDRSGDDGSVGKETEDAAFHRAAREIIIRVGQWVGTAVMDWGGGDGW